MNAREDRPDADLSAPASPASPTAHADSAVLTFESEWQSGHHPRIEDFLNGVAEPARSTLFVRLLTTEISFRRRQGETPRPEDYSGRFPEYQARLSEIDWAAAALASTVLGSGEETRRLDHFKLLERIGAGGFGTVWKARDLTLGRFVAIKIPHPHRFTLAGTGSLLREARAAAQLRHPNVVQIHEVRDDGELAYIVYDLVEGVTLQQWLSAKRPSPVEAARLCARLARAIHHAHESRVIHRDLKPGNVLIDRAGEPHVTDFGIAKGGEAAEDPSTRDGQVLGSLPYLSPEQASGRSSEADARTDVYGLGIILYEMLAGQRPFRGDDPMVLHQILTEEPPPIRKARPEVPRDLETICQTAMAKEPARRYATAAELADDLERFLGGLPIKARRAGPVERSVLWTRRHATKVMLMSAGAAVTAAIAAPVIAIPSVRRRVFPRETVPDEVDPVFLSDGPADLVPDGSDKLERRPVVIRTNPQGADVWLFERNRRTGWYKAREGERIGTRRLSPTEVTADLRPGEYLVVAVKGDEFVEAARWVPYPNNAEEEAPFLYRNLFWELKGDTVYLDVEIRPAAPARMVRFDGLDALAFPYPVGTLENGQPDYRVRRLSVPPFLMARDEFTWAEHRMVDETERWNVKRDPALPGRYAMVNVSFDEAASLLEYHGMRMPREAEWYAAARRAPSWDALRSQAPHEGFGPVGTPASDYVGPPPGVRGIFSNVAEWTSDWGVPLPADEKVAAAGWRGGFAQLVRQTRAVRGGSIEVIEASSAGSVLSPKFRDPRQRVSVERGNVAYAGLGFRGIRSVGPPINFNDFVQDLGRDTPSVATISTHLRSC